MGSPTEIFKTPIIHYPRQDALRSSYLVLLQSLPPSQRGAQRHNNFFDNAEDFWFWAGTKPPGNRCFEMRIENINPPNVALTLELTVPSDVVLPPVFSVELWNNDINHISVNYTGDNPVGTFIRTVHYHADGTPVYAYPEYTDLGTLGSRYRIPHRFYESMRENGYPCEQDLPRALNIAETWKTILDHVRTGNPTAPALSPKPLL